jgi:poly-gamma-glutamate capsule biosynthesis protein CapA/YwtB (metallophosphatase superfamily)
MTTPPPIMTGYSMVCDTDVVLAGLGVAVVGIGVGAVVVVTGGAAVDVIAVDVFGGGDTVVVGASVVVRGSVVDSVDVCATTAGMMFPNCSKHIANKMTT